MTLTAAAAARPATAAPATVTDGKHGLKRGPRGCAAFFVFESGMGCNAQKQRKYEDDDRDRGRADAESARSDCTANQECGRATCPSGTGPISHQEEPCRSCGARSTP